MDRFTRRGSLAKLGGLVAATVGGRALLGADEAEGGNKAVETGVVTCVLTPELTEGPYYIAGEKVRRDIREGHPGTLLTLNLRVLNVASCAPIKGAAVDIWHADAAGNYSGFGAGAGSRTFLRGIQRTDSKGLAVFTTIYPGWYQGRAVHIHTKVHVGGTMTDAGYEGGHTCHTGQFFFAESAVLDSAKEEPYSTSTTTRTTLTEDTIYDRSGVAGGLLKLSYRKGGMARGVTGSITMGVDPDETHDGTDL